MIVEGGDAMDCRKILVPMDGSDSSLRAAEQALEIAAVYGAELEYLYVVDLEGVLANREAVQGNSVLEEAVEAGKAVLDQALDRTPVGLPARGRCISGSAAKAILKAATEDQADMIVMGSRGLGAFRAAILGSVSSYVLEHAKCPVVLVKAGPVDMQT